MSCGSWEPTSRENLQARERAAASRPRARPVIRISRHFRQGFEPVGTDIPGTEKSARCRAATFGERFVASEKCDPRRPGQRPKATIQRKGQCHGLRKGKASADLE